MKLRIRNGLGATQTQAQFLTQAEAAVKQAAVAGGSATPQIIDQSGNVSITGPAVSASSSIAQQAALASFKMTAAETEEADNLAADAWGIQQMHLSPASANATPFLAPGVTDKGAVGAPPSYISTLPQYPKAKGSQNPGTFPYQNPAPHWTTNNKWWTGQTVLNVGSPRYSNDPWEYLRSALVDSNWTMFKNWCVWFLQEAGKAPSTVFASAQPWAGALAAVNLSDHKYIMTSEGPVFLPFSYADLTGIQTATKSYEYGYDAATLANYLADWVSQVLPNVADFPIATRLNPDTSTSPSSPFGANYIPAMYRVGSTFLSQVAPYLTIFAIAAGGLAGVLLAGSGIGAEAAIDTAAATSDAGADAAVAAAGLTDAAVADSLPVAGDIAADAAAATVLPEVVVTGAATAADVGATTALTAAAAAGASTVAAAAATGSSGSDTTLDEVDVSSTPLTSAPSADLSLPATDLSAAAAANAASQVNIPSQNNSPTTQQGESAASALAKLIKLLTGGSTAPTSAAGDGSGSDDNGDTGAAQETLGDFLSDLTSSDWLWILAAGATGLYFVHKSRPHRKPAAKVRRVSHA